MTDYMAAPMGACLDGAATSIAAAAPMSIGWCGLDGIITWHDGARHAAAASIVIIGSMASSDCMGEHGSTKPQHSSHRPITATRA